MEIAESYLNLHQERRSDSKTEVNYGFLITLSVSVGIEFKIFQAKNDDLNHMINSLHYLK